MRKFYRNASTIDKSNVFVYADFHTCKNEKAIMREEEVL